MNQHIDQTFMPEAHLYSPAFSADDFKRYVGQKEAQPFIDEQVVLYDAMERLRAYTYVAVIDVDEIIYARTSPQHNIKRFMVSETIIN